MHTTIICIAYSIIGVLDHELICVIGASHGDQLLPADLIADARLVSEVAKSQGRLVLDDQKLLSGRKESFLLNEIHCLGHFASFNAI